MKIFEITDYQHNVQDVLDKLKTGVYLPAWQNKFINKKLNYNIHNHAVSLVWDYKMVEVKPLDSHDVITWENWDKFYPDLSKYDVRDELEKMAWIYAESDKITLNNVLDGDFTFFWHEESRWEYKDKKFAENSWSFFKKYFSKYPNAPTTPIPETWKKYLVN